MALHLLTRDESPYVAHSMADGIAMIAIASCDAMTLERDLDAPACILSPSRDRDRHRASDRLRPRSP